MEDLHGWPGVRSGAELREFGPAHRADPERVSPGNAEGPKPCGGLGPIGAACGNRTHDLLITSETLCRLS